MLWEGGLFWNLGAAERRNLGGFLGAPLKLQCGPGLGLATWGSRWHSSLPEGLTGASRKSRRQRKREGGHFASRFLQGNSLFSSFALFPTGHDFRVSSLGWGLRK